MAAAKRDEAGALIERDSRRMIEGAGVQPDAAHVSDHARSSARFIGKRATTPIAHAHVESIILVSDDATRQGHAALWIAPALGRPAGRRSRIRPAWLTTAGIVGGDGEADHKL
jgi:hypothetical protein